MLIQSHETQDQLKLVLHKQSDRHLDYFLNSKCATDIIQLGLFPNVKEITESYAALRAFNKFFKRDPLYKDAYIVVHGDGVGPRTGAVFAFHTDREVFSIDPLMKFENQIEDAIVSIQEHDSWEEGAKKVKRLTCVKSGIEEWEVPEHLENRTCVLVGVHSHASFDDAITPFSAEANEEGVCVCPYLGIINIACCYPFDYVGGAEEISYMDWGIHSEKREVKVWKEDNYFNFGAPDVLA